MIRSIHVSDLQEHDRILHITPGSFKASRDAGIDPAAWRGANPLDLLSQRHIVESDVYVTILRQDAGEIEEEEAD